MSAYGERIARVEVEIKELRKSFDDHKEQTNSQFNEIKAGLKETNQKMDDLLTLRNKGAGVFWLMSLLVGTGVLSIGSEFLRWLFGR